MVNDKNKIIMILDHNFDSITVIKFASNFKNDDKSQIFYSFLFRI